MVSKVCAICLEDICGKSSTSYLKPCGHEYHSDCIRKWHGHAEDLKCPMCRIDAEELVVKLYGCAEKIIDLQKGFAVNQVVNHVINTEPDLIDELAEALDNNLHISELRTDTQVEPEAPPSRPRLLQCGICGDQDDLVLEHYCEECQTLYHGSCLRVLAIETGERTDWCVCVDCRKELISWNDRIVIKNSQLASRDDGSLMYDTNNSMVFEGQLREKNSVRAEQIYRDCYLESLKKTKTNIQKHVRKCLDTYYHSGKIDHMEYTRINKTVSRKLYTLSNYTYSQELNYDHLAKQHIETELGTPLSI